MNIILFIIFLWWGMKPAFGLFFKNMPIVGTAVYSLGIIAFSCCYILAYLMRRKPLLVNRAFLFLFVAYSAYYFGTLMYFDYTDRLAEIIKYVALGAPALVAAIGAKNDSGERSVRVFSTALMFSGALLTVLIVIVGQGSDGRFGMSESFHPNVVGFYLAVSLFCASSSYVRWGYMGYLTLAVISLGLLLTLSKTTLLSVAFAYCCAKYLNRRPGTLSWVLTTVKISSIVILLAGVVVWVYYDYFEHYIAVAGGKLVFTLTGRTIIWQELLSGPYLNWMGHGLSVFDLYGPQPFPNIIHSAHNELLNQIFSFGIFGALFLIVYYLIALYWSHSLNGKYKFFFLIFCFASVRSLVESPLYEFNFPFVLFGLMSGTVVIKKSRCADPELNVTTSRSIK